MCHYNPRQGMYTSQPRNVGAVSEQNSKDTGRGCKYLWPNK